ncbi:MAG: hypothetical protein OXM59_07540 [Gammaproteobacteria bacterium]|nr:hypothetical protein [Gammaproteobacteria bacterium]
MSPQEQAQELGRLVLEKRELGTQLACWISKQDRIMNALRTAQGIAGGNRPPDHPLEGYPTEEELRRIPAEIERCRERIAKIDELLRS